MSVYYNELCNMARVVTINRLDVKLLDMFYLFNLFSDPAKTHTCQPSVNVCQ